MYIIQKFEYKKENENWKHTSTRLIKTFPERKQAEQYLENCLLLNTYNNEQKQEYKMEKIGI